MDQNIIEGDEIKKVRQLLAKNIDDFKYLILCNMRLEGQIKPSSQPLRLDMNRISELQQKFDDSGETLEQWVAKQKIRPKKSKSSSQTVIDMVEQWLMNEAKKDLFAEMDAVYGGPEELSSEYVRQLGLNLISLADKLDRMKAQAPEI